MRVWCWCVVIAAVACGGDKATGPVACDTYTGGILSNSGGLTGSYTLASLCQGTKPDLRPPDATGTVTLDATTFTASLTIQSAPIVFSGEYTTSTPDGITINLTSPVSAQYLGTFRLRNDSLSVSGTVGGQRLSLVGTRVVP